MKTVVVFGAGVAGLTVAHEFAKLGYKVFVFEANKNAGGFFRSSRHDGIPTEYSWHGMGPWYHNVFDIIKQIPFDENGTIYDKGLSRPINFGVAPDKIETNFNEAYIFKKPKAFRMSLVDKLKWFWLLLKTWTSNLRTVEYYSKLNAADQWDRILTKKGAKTWKATFGPWIGSDWTNVSLHHAGQFFRKNLMSGKTHNHKSDKFGPEWKHGSKNGWLLLNGPSNECWFNKWVEYLKSKNVEFFFEQSLNKFDFDGENITAAYLDSGLKIKADIYVLAINPFYVPEIINKTPLLSNEEQLKLFEPLTESKPHTQVSFRIAFSELIKWPMQRSAIIVADSEFNLTLFAQEQVWTEDVNLGKDIKSLWTVTACAATVPGRIYGLPLVNCTKEQFIEEVMKQLLDCEGLDYLIKKANGRSLKSFEIIKIEIWEEWIFSADGIKFRQPKWVNNTSNQQYLPSQATSIPNLIIAGAHTKTTADLWSIEAAVESGRLAVKVIEPNVKVFSQYKNPILKFISYIDDLFYLLNCIHFLDILLFGLLIFSSAYIFSNIFLK